MIAYQVKYALERNEEGIELWVASPVELPGCMTQGETKEEALERLKEMLPALMASMHQIGAEIPVPGVHEPTEWVETEWPWDVRPGAVKPRWLERVSRDVVFVGEAANGL